MNTPAPPFTPRVALRPPLIPGASWCAELRVDAGMPAAFVYGPTDQSVIYRMIAAQPEAQRLPFVGVK